MMACEEPPDDPVPAGGMAGRCTNGRSVTLRRDAVARDRSLPRRPDGRRRRRAEQPNVFYIGVNNGGVWKTTDYGLHLDADLRRPADPLDRRDRGRAVRSEHPLCRQRRRPAAAGSLRRRRHLQIHRRGQDLAASRPARGRRSARSSSIRRTRTAVRRGARPSVRSQRGARRLPLHRRRRDVAEGALQGREHRRHRPGVRLRRTPRRSTRCSGRRARGRGRYDDAAGPTSGLFKSTRRRHDLAAADAAVCPTLGRRPEPHRHRHRAERSEADLRAGSPRKRPASIDPTMPARAGRG